MKVKIKIGMTYRTNKIISLNWFVFLLYNAFFFLINQVSKCMGFAFSTWFTTVGSSKFALERLCFEFTFENASPGILLWIWFRRNVWALMMLWDILIFHQLLDINLYRRLGFSFPSLCWVQCSDLGEGVVPYRAFHHREERNG